MRVFSVRLSVIEYIELKIKKLKRRKNICLISFATNCMIIRITVKLTAVNNA